MSVGQIQISGLTQGSPVPELVLPPYYIPSATSFPNINTVTLNNGSPTTVSLYNPTVNGVLIIVPPNYAWPTPGSSFAGTITFKGASGDTGFLISNTWPTVIALTSTSATSIVLLASTSGATCRIVTM